MTIKGLKIDGSRFTQTPWATPKDKLLAITQLIKFIESGCGATKFTKRAYDMLYLHCFGHIAHYNRSGFYYTWFSTPEQRAEWVVYVRRGGAFGLHDERRTDLWGDVERALLAWLDESGFGDYLIQAGSDNTERRERELLAKLQDKYGAGTIVPPAQQ